MARPKSAATASCTSARDGAKTQSLRRMPGLHHLPVREAVKAIHILTLHVHTLLRAGPALAQHKCRRQEHCSEQPLVLDAISFAGTRSSTRTTKMLELRCVSNHLLLHVQLVCLECLTVPMALPCADASLNGHWVQGVLQPVPPARLYAHIMVSGCASLQPSSAAVCRIVAALP